MLPQKNFLTYISIGLLTVLAGEFQVQVLAAQKGLGGLFSTLLLYVFFLALMYAVGKFLDKKISQKNGDVVYYLVGGLFGLAIEWSMGNGPWVGNGAIQAGMFAWWTAVFFVPRIFVQGIDAVAKQVQHRIIIFLSAYSAVSTLIIIISPIHLRPAFAGIMLAAAYIVMNFQFIPYLSKNGFSPALARRFMLFLALCGLAGLFI